MSRSRTSVSVHVCSPDRPTLVAAPWQPEPSPQRAWRGERSGEALARRGQRVGAVDRVNRLLLRGRELWIQRLTEIPIEIRREGRRLPQLAPLGRQLPPPPREATGVHQERAHEEQQRHLPRQPPLHPRRLPYSLLPLLQQGLLLAPGLGPQPLAGAHLRLLEGRRGLLHRLGQRGRRR